MEATSGRVAVSEWHAQGVGTLLSKEELSETLLARNGVELFAATESQPALIRWAAGAVAPASVAH